jgi:Tfp pilus assembly protein PilP
MTRSGHLFLALTWVLPCAAAAQEPPSPAPGGVPAIDGSSVDAEADEVIREILEPGQYQYQPLGRRDPFVSLLANVSPDGGPSQRPPGMPGFLISEVTLKGIVLSRGEFVALLEATDGNSYFARVGQEFYDGSLVAMDEATATFSEQVRDPLSPVRSREVTKSLYPPEEAR